MQKIFSWFKKNYPRSYAILLSAICLMLAAASQDLHKIVVTCIIGLLGLACAFYGEGIGERKEWPSLPHFKVVGDLATVGLILLGCLFFGLLFC